MLCDEAVINKSRRMVGILSLVTSAIRRPVIKTSIAGIQISNWILVLAAIIVIWIIYSFISH